MQSIYVHVFDVFGFVVNPISLLVWIVSDANPKTNWVGIAKVIILAGKWRQVYDLSLGTCRSSKPCFGFCCPVYMLLVYMLIVTPQRPHTHTDTVGPHKSWLLPTSHLPLSHLPIFIRSPSCFPFYVLFCMMCVSHSLCMHSLAAQRLCMPRTTVIPLLWSSWWEQAPTRMPWTM